MSTNSTGAVGRTKASAILAALVGLGILLRLVQYFAGESLWLDEAMLSINIVSRTPWELISAPLYFNQIAPPLFLLAAKGTTAVLGPSEFALRLPAFVASIAALILFAFLARRVLEGAAVPFAVGLFAVSPMLVAYGAEVKQYSGDVTAAVLLTLLTLELRVSHFSRQLIVAAALTGPAIVWLSQGSVIVLVGLGSGIAVLALLERDRSALTAIGAVAVAWSVASIASILVARHTMGPGAHAFLLHYWRRDFMPLHAAPGETALWLYGVIRSFYAPGLGFRTIGGLCVAVAALGVWALWRNGRRDVVLLLSGPFVATLAASAVHEYPFSGRLTLFLFPAFIVAVSAGAAWLASWWRNRVPAMEAATLLFFAAAPAYGVVFRHPPWWREDTKPVLAHVAANRREGDAIYVFAGARPAMSFYASRYGFTSGDWIRGGYHKRDTRSYLRDLDHLRGRARVWIILAHTNFGGQRQAVVGYLGVIGTRRDSVAGRHNGTSADAVGYLYDLSDSVRLKSSSADSYPLR